MKKFMVLAVLVISNCFAVSVPDSSEYDSRITYDVYNPDEVVKLYVKDGFISTINLQNDERVIDMFTGFVDGWDIQNRGSFVFIKPKTFVNKQAGNIAIFPTNPTWNTNLVITTTKRVYFFDLILVEKQQPIYKINFDYPVERTQKQEQAKINSEIAQRRNEDVNFIKDRLTNLNNPRNWDFYMKVNQGSNNIAPVFAYDDGIFTYLGFDNTKSIPSVFLYDEKTKEEAILNTHMKEQGEFQILVVHKVAPAMLLRAGNKVVGIFNKGFGVNPAPAGTTISPEVIREVR
jgi:type IV secretion system protein VirB9